MTKKTVKAAAVQMDSKLGDVTTNLQKADILVEDAFKEGSDLVILPEFFTSAAGFHPSMLDAALPLKGKAFELLMSKAKKYNSMVGGSYIAIKENGDRYNTFVLAMPDGSYQSHDKDLPTMWENCYYVPGNDDGVLDTPIGPVGVAMCWEFVRSQTARRLLGNIDLLVGGSCWWDVPYKKFPVPFKSRASKGNKEIMHQTPSRMGRMLGVPVIHAAHTGYFECNTPMIPGVTFYSYFLGEAQIIDASGNIIKRMKFEDGEGIISAEVEIGRTEPSESIPDRFWIPRFHSLIMFSWYQQNFHGRRFYRKVTRNIRAV
jgi:predicted amidohydrolase